MQVAKNSSAKQPTTVLSPAEFETLVARLELLMQEAVSQESVGWQAEGEDLKMIRQILESCSLFQRNTS